MGKSVSIAAFVALLSPFFFFFHASTSRHSNAIRRPPPNIVYILADDLGYNDVSWHDPSVKTPHLARLASRSLMLASHYVQPNCTPSRAALMTGYYPIHTGSQLNPLTPLSPMGLYTNFTLLPQWLNRMGYRSHAIGKWHLGFCNVSYLPTRRGFESFYGFWGGSQDYFTHEGEHPVCGDKCGYDFRNNEEVDLSAKGTYSSRLFAARARKIIAEHSSSASSVDHSPAPMFLYLALQNVHGPIQAEKQHTERYPKTRFDPRRLTQLGMISAMDDAVGEVVKELKRQKMFKNTLIVFTSDNGALETCSSNRPLRGEKNSVFEGGTRTAAFVKLPGRSDGRSYEGIFHITDWLPTLYSAAGGRKRELGGIDGVDQWQHLRRAARGVKEEASAFPRQEMLYNLRMSKDGRTLKASRGDWKLVRDVLRPRFPPRSRLHRCAPMDWKPDGGGEQGRPGWRLFNLTADPGESTDLSSARPDVVALLRGRLEEYGATAIRPHISLKYVPAGKDGNFRTGWCTAAPY